jgi:hypothetical protein
MPHNTNDPVKWAELVGAYAAGDLARMFPDRDDYGAVAERVARIEDTVPPGESLVLIGAQAAACARVLAPGREGAVTVLDPVGRRALGPEDGFSVVRCDWAGLGAACPDADALAVLDVHAAAWLLSARATLWHLTEHVRERLLLIAPLCADAKHTWRAAPKGSGFVFSDSFVRGVLHDARFFEVADLATIVDGVPGDGEDFAPRISRFT